MNELPNNAARYGTLWCLFDEVNQLSEACDALDITWLAESHGKDTGLVDFRFFFDEAGKQNYLAGLYDDKSDIEQSIKWELVDNEYLCFESGDFSGTININPEYHEDGGEFLYTVMCNSNLLEEEFAVTVGSAIIAAEKVLKAALKDKDE